MTTFSPGLIGLDWGTTQLRAYLLAADGQVLERKTEPKGIMQVRDRAFASVLSEIVAPWRERYGHLTMLACGMIGSRQGWLETPYLECPASPVLLAERLVKVDTDDHGALWLVPGVSYRNALGIPDVIRGEETQILGTLASAIEGSQLLVLPGTHSKWVAVAGDRIVRFNTFMSGELFAVLREHSILGRLMSGREHDDKAFLRGLKNAATAGGLLGKLFSTRTLGLFGEVADTGLHAYLSGLIIGSELDEGLLEFAGAYPEAVTLIGEGELVDLYASAFQLRAINPNRAGSDAAAVGLVRIARVAGLMEMD